MKEEQEKKQEGKFSRRDFLVGAGTILAGSSFGGMLSGCVGKETTTENVSVTATKTKTMTTTVEITKIEKEPLAAPAIGHVTCNVSICAGCRTCEAVCSIYHEGMIFPMLSRIQVEKDELGGYVCESKSCKQCPGPECLAVCPTGALHVDEITGARVINSELCCGCKLCMNACIATPPRIRYNDEKDICCKCDLCDGDPQCVKFCPTGALTFVKESV